MIGAEIDRSRSSMLRTLRSGASIAVPLALVLYSSPTSASDPLPLPQVEYEARATTIGGGQVATRHAQGRFRVETTIPGVAQTVISIIDSRSRKVQTMLPIPGVLGAVEIDLGDELSPGIAIGRGRRVGTASVAGEACELWEIDPPREVKRAGPGSACLSYDQIPLRVEATINGRLQTVFEVTELRRVRQDPKVFALPANVQVMRVPKGASNLLPMLPNLIPGAK
jgi:hypothetical protein